MVKNRKVWVCISLALCQTRVEKNILVRDLKILSDRKSTALPARTFRNYLESDLANIVR
jgi:hypothetical protein